MAGNVILDNMSKPEALGLSKLVEILSRSTRDNDTKRGLETLGLEIGANKPKQRETGRIVFEKPEMNLRDWLENLRRSGIKPKYNMHYREINNRTEINTNKASYILDEDESGKQAVEEMLSKNPRADEKEREKAYYDGVEEARKRNRDARRAVANWDIIEKDGENDTREEDPLLRYIDRQNNKIDWYSTMCNLAGYGKRSGYSEGHYKRCIDHWVSFFAPDLRPITESLSADKAGSFLSSLTIPDSDLEIVERNLKSLKRKPGEKLFSVISHLSALAERMYQEYEEAERLVLIERILFNGLWCFTTGEGTKFFHQRSPCADHA
jgi:hypothetical protein